jgi:hypothetical protein
MRYVARHAQFIDPGANRLQLVFDHRPAERVYEVTVQFRPAVSSPRGSIHRIKLTPVDTLAASDLLGSGGESRRKSLLHPWLTSHLHDCDRENAPGSVGVEHDSNLDSNDERRWRSAPTDGNGSDRLAHRPRVR